MSSWRNTYPNAAAAEDFATTHPFIVLGYSIALIVVYLIVILPLYRKINGSGLISTFQSNLLYTGPGGALDNLMGSCRSDRESGPYASCGAAEAFANGAKSAYSAAPLQFSKGAAKLVTKNNTNEGGVLRHMSQKSRFIGDRSPDAVFALDQGTVDEMAAEISSITGDNEAAVTLGIHQGDTQSNFSTRAAENNLSNIGYGYA